MRLRRRTSTAVAFAVLLLASAAVAGVPTNVVAQADEPTAENGSDGDARATNDSWATYRADSARTGATGADGPEPYAAVAWRDRFTGAPTASPTVVDGTAYLAVETGDAETPRGAVAAYDAASGDLQWDRTGLGAPHGSPTVVDDTAYVVTGADTSELGWAREDDGAGGLYALDADTGETEWVRNDTDSWRDAPAYASGLLFAVRQPETPEHADSSLVAVDADNGETRWSVQAERLVAAGNGTVFATDERRQFDEPKRLYAVDAATGERLWTVEVPGTIDFGEAAVTDAALFATDDRDGRAEVRAYATGDGSLRWNATAANGSDWASRPAVADDGVFVAVEGASGDESVVRLDAATGAVVWRYDRPNGVLSSAPTVANDTVLVAGESLRETSEVGEAGNGPYRGWMTVAVDADAGTERWASVFDHGERMQYAAPASPSVVGDRLYLAANEDTWPDDATGYLFVANSTTSAPDGTNVPSDGVHEEDLAPDARVDVTRTDPDAEFGDEMTVALNGSASSVRNGTITGYEWDVDDDGSYERTGAETTVTLEPCEFTTVTLRVTTDGGATATESVQLAND